MKVSVKTTVTGNAGAAISRHLRSMGVKVEKGMIAAANVLMDASLPLVPREIDALVESASITKAGGGLLTVIYVGYGLRNRLGEVIRGPGPGYQKSAASTGRKGFRVPANYAWIQHFNRSFAHKVGQADFLGEPSRTKIPEMRSAFNEAYRGPVSG